MCPARGLITEATRSSHLADLAISGYAIIRPSRALLEEGIRRYAASGAETMRTVFATLGSGATTLPEAVEQASFAIKAAVSAPIHIVSADVMTDVPLNAIIATWPGPVATRLLRRQAKVDLALMLPAHLAAVVRVCQWHETGGIRIL